MPFLAKEHYPIPDKDIVSWIFDDLPYDQDKPVYIDALDPSRSYSARQAKRMIRQLVHGLRELGFKKGDCLCLHSPNDLYFPLVFLAVTAAGGIFTATNVAYKPLELTHHFLTARVTWVLVAPTYLDPVLQIVSEGKALVRPTTIILFDTYAPLPLPSNFPTWSHLLRPSAPEADWHRLTTPHAASHTPAALLFSSGTTGLPKAVSLSHKNFIAQHTLVYEHPLHARPYPNASRLYMLPLFHAATAPAAYVTPLRTGNAAYIAARFDLETWFRCMHDFAITDMLIVPPLALMIVNSPLRHKYPLSAVRVAHCGAAPLDAVVQARVQALCADGAWFTQVWGATETSCVAMMFPFAEGDASGSVGRALPGVDVMLVDERGRDVTAFGVRGELCVRGPTVTMGYYLNDEANRTDFKDGYWYTGDVAYCEEETGKWYIVDRKKELIKVRGFQIAPPELEGVLLSHPDIVDAAVIGVKTSRDESSEYPRAYIVRRPGSENSITEKDVRQWIEDRLIYYKRLDGGVVFVDAIPKTASGKILKRMLREQAAKEMSAKL